MLFSWPRAAEPLLEQHATDVKRSISLIKQTQREVDRRLLAFFFFRLALLLCLEVEHKLPGRCVAGVQSVASPPLGMLQQSLLRARLPLHILPHRTVYIAEVGLVEERTIMVVDVLGQLFHADARRAYTQQYC